MERGTSSSKVTKHSRKAKNLAIPEGLNMNRISALITVIKNLIDLSITALLKDLNLIHLMFQGMNNDQGHVSL